MKKYFDSPKFQIEPEDNDDFFVIAMLVFIVVVVVYAWYKIYNQ